MDGKTKIEDDQKHSDGKSFTVPVTVYFTTDGTLSIDLKIIDSDDSELGKMLDGKTIDERRSMVGVFSKDSSTLPNTFIWLSGMFNFTDKATYVSPEAIDRRVIELMAKRIVYGVGSPCSFCVNDEICSHDLQQLPSEEVCMQKVVQYFYERAKQPESND